MMTHCSSHRGPPAVVAARRLLVLFVLAFVAAVAFVLLLAACAGGAPTVVAPIERATCVLLRAEYDDATVDEICATADELAPLVPLLVAERRARRVDAGALTERPASLDPPTRRVTRPRTRDAGP